MSGTAAHDPLVQVSTLAQALMQIIGLARALAEAGRAIDLGGLDGEIGLLCAKVLDLPPDAGRSVRPQLIALSDAIEALSRTLAARAAPSG